MLKCKCLIYNVNLFTFWDVIKKDYKKLYQIRENKIIHIFYMEYRFFCYRDNKEKYFESLQKHLKFWSKFVTQKDKDYSLTIYRNTEGGGVYTCWLFVIIHTLFGHSRFNYIPPILFFLTYFYAYSGLG